MEGGPQDRVPLGQLPLHGVGGRSSVVSERWYQTRDLRGYDSFSSAPPGRFVARKGSGIALGRGSYSGTRDSPESAFSLASEGTCRFPVFTLNLFQTLDLMPPSTLEDPP